MSGKARYEYSIVKNRAAVIFVLIILMAGLSGIFSGVFAKTTKTSVSGTELMKGKQFTLANMPYSGAYSIIKSYNGKKVTPAGVQNFEFTPDGKYVINLGVCRVGGKEHPLLTRCVRPWRNGAFSYAICVEATVLYGYAHPEVLAVTQPDRSKEVYNLWVASNPGKSYLGREITRLTYEVKNGKGMITKRVTVCGFKKANRVKGKAATFRGGKSPIAVQTAIDEGSNQIVFRLRMPSGYGVIYVAYTFSKLNAVLDALPNGGKYKIKKAGKWQTAILRCGIRPYDTFQSFDVSGNKLYLCGGHFKKSAGVYVVKFKHYPEGKAKEQVKSKVKNVSKIVTIEPKLRVSGKKLDKNSMEIEGLKVFKRADGKMDYYVNFIITGTGLRNTIGIYKFTR